MSSNNFLPRGLYEFNFHFVSRSRDSKVCRLHGFPIAFWDEEKQRKVPYKGSRQMTVQVSLTEVNEEGQFDPKHITAVWLTLTGLLQSFMTGSRVWLRGESGGEDHSWFNTDMVLLGKPRKQEVAPIEAADGFQAVGEDEVIVTE